jgi:hypothetical protein
VRLQRGQPEETIQPTVETMPTLQMKRIHHQQQEEGGHFARAKACIESK